MITVKDSGFLPLSIHKRQKNVVYNTSRELFMTELIKFNLYYNWFTSLFYIPVKNLMTKIFHVLFTVRGNMR